MKNNTTGSERWDIQIIQQRITQKVVKSKKIYNRKKLKKVNY